MLFVETLKAGESIDLERQVIIEGTAEAGAYSLPVHIQYDGGNETSSSQVQVLTLLVINLPQIQISYYRPIELVQVGQTIELPIEIMNIGRTSLNISQVEVIADQIEVETARHLSAHWMEVRLPSSMRSASLKRAASWSCN